VNMLSAGTGALACLFAARLASSGNEVTMSGSWAEGLTALRQYGVRILDLDGSTQSYCVEVMNSSESKGDFLQCLVLVKSWQTEQVAKQLGKCLSDKGIALTLQNGLGNDEILKATLTPERVALGVTTVGARMLEPGYVQFTGNGKIFLGAHPQVSGLTRLLEEAGFQVEVVLDPVSLLWGKLLINAAINPLTALLRVKNGELLEQQATRELLGAVAKEAASVAKQQGINMPYPDPILAVEEVARNTATNYSSMLQDVLRGTVTEIEAINGAIVRKGECIGVPTPVNRVLWQLVKSLHHH
jgi:2-dehydropantoate 2-reductase